MPSNITVNKLTSQHKASVGVTAAFPDVCKTPAPPAPAPVPIPYPNVGNSAMAADKVTKKVKDNKQSVMVKGSNYTLTNGDQPGIALGVISNKIMGKSGPLNQSFDIKYEKKGVARLTDPHGNNAGSKPNVPNPAEVQPPSMVIPGMTAEQKKACEEVDKKRVKDEDRDKVALENGMDPGHAKRISKTCQGSKQSVTFRQTNPACLDKVKKGFPAKGCDVPEKTVSAKTIGSATGDAQKKIKEFELEGFVGAYKKDKNGKISKPLEMTGLKTTDGEIPFDKLTSKPPPPKNIYTGDYDAHDMFGRDGKRIMDGSKQEADFQRSLNRSVGRGELGPDKDMIRHGPQNNYKDYYDREGKKKGKEFVPSLAKPDVSPKEPLMAFDSNGQMYKLETEDDLRNYYKCKGAETPPEWGDKTEIPPDRKDKILKGERKLDADGNPTKEIRGAHSADCLDSPDFDSMVMGSHPNGCKQALLQKKFPDGSISKTKQSTMFPSKWNDNKIMGATKKVGDSPPIGKPRLNKDGSYTTYHKGTVDGVTMEVRKNGNTVVQSNPVWPQ